MTHGPPRVRTRMPPRAPRAGADCQPRQLNGAAEIAEGAGGGRALVHTGVSHSTLRSTSRPGAPAGPAPPWPPCSTGEWNKQEGVVERDFSRSMSCAPAWAGGRSSESGCPGGWRTGRPSSRPAYRKTGGHLGRRAVDRGVRIGARPGDRGRRAADRRRCTGDAGRIADVGGEALAPAGLR